MKYNKLIFLSLTIALGYCSKAQDEPKLISDSTPTPTPQPAPITENGALVAFFTDYFTNPNLEYSKSNPIEIKQINKAREQVWKAWKEANSKRVDTKLISLSPLTSRNSSTWQLPPEGGQNTRMPYYYGSKGVKPSDGYPLYLYLHGSGDKNSEWTGAVSMCNNFNDSPSVYFIPQIPNIGEYYRWWQRSKQVAWEHLIRLAFLSDEINANKIYFFGISEGGYGSQRLASFYADYLAAAGPMAGGEPLINAPVENCQNIAFSLRTGELDYMFHRDVLTSYTKERFELFASKYPNKFINWIELIKGAGHGIDYTKTTPWLRNYTRNPYPKQFTWEDFQMDGMYRKGFYNLKVIERPKTDNRIYYEMSINDNIVELKINQVEYQVIQTSPRWGFPMAYSKNYKLATGGKVLIYLSDELIDLNKKVKVIANGKEVFNADIQPDEKHLINSCTTFFDPKRLYPIAVEVNY